MATVTEICNQALAHIGVSAYIDNLTEQSEEAEQCNFHYELARDYVLGAAQWAFAKKFVALAEVPAASSTLHPNWDYQYRYPSDCLRLLRILTEGTRTPVLQNSYEIQQDETGKRIIFTDVEEACMEYISRTTDPSLFSQHFSDTVAANLAWRIAMPLTKNPEVQSSAFDIFRFSIDQAMERNSNEEQDSPRRTSEFVEDRLN